VGDAASQIDLAPITEVRTGLSGKRVHTDQAGVDGGQEYDGICVQARQVGGDYYDFLNLSEDRLAATLLIANLQANLRSQCDIALDEPMRALKSVNRLFYQNATEGAYATLFFAEQMKGRCGACAT
jgi:serine phosphatase RsbU (regulator of sigma subunit)